ncbi:hypothetical protein [Pseudomonas sp. GWSMS-1]|uniref:hypothetical protein n=1 Tax=Pseudomonas sp. GWSMS-1 TaxID=3308997 RepID=UPI003CF02036
MFHLHRHGPLGKIECYDPFNQLVEVYRDMNGGDCMVNVYLAGRESERPPAEAVPAAGLALV